MRAKLILPEGHYIQELGPEQEHDFTELPREDQVIHITTPKGANLPFRVTRIEDGEHSRPRIHLEAEQVGTAG